MPYTETRIALIGKVWLATGVLVIIAEFRELFSIMSSEYRYALSGQIIITCIAITLALGSIFGAAGLLYQRRWARTLLMCISSIYLFYALIFVVFAYFAGFDLARLNAMVFWVLGILPILPFWLYSLAVLYLGTLSTTSLMLLRRKPINAW